MRNGGGPAEGHVGRQHALRPQQQPARRRGAQALFWSAGRDHAAGESVRVGRLTLPQVRRTNTLIGGRAAGAWGCWHGVNEHGLAMGATPTHTRLRDDAAGLTGADLVRLTLERSSTARQGVDAAAGLITRHGQGPYPGCPADEDHDNAFLIADAREAYLLAACGGHWAVQQVGSVRALNEVCHLGKDWDRISPGLADLAIGRGWWASDGSKLDFAGALAADGGAGRLGYGWWGRATMLLEQHSGAVDHALMRRLLGEPAPTHPSSPPTRAVGLAAQLGPDADGVPVAWCSFGPAVGGLYFPLPVVAEPPPTFRCDGSEDNGCPLWRLTAGEAPGAAIRAVLAEVQAAFDQAAGEFAAEAAALRRRRDGEGLRRLAESFTQSNWERFEDAWEGLRGKEAAWETACRTDGD